MKLLVSLVVLLATSNLLSFGAPDTLLTRLNRAIQQKEKYRQEKASRIEKLHAALARTSARNLGGQFELLSSLLFEYKTFIYDSAFTYSERLEQVARAQRDPIRIAYAKNQAALVLLSSGMFKETLDSLGDLSMKKMPDSIRVDHYFILARAYYDLGDFDKDRFYSPRYTQLGNKYLDSAKSLCPPGSYMEAYLGGLRNIRNENNEDALLILTQLLRRKNITRHQEAVIASTLSAYYISRNQTDEAIALLTRAAISDVETATTETAAISSLADLLYKNGDVEDSYNFILQAMDDALFYGARQRQVKVSALQHVIAAAKLTTVDARRKQWLTYSFLVTALTVVVIVFIIIILNQLKKRKIAEKALVEANKIKEEYIGYYFNVNSEYLNKFEAFKSAVEMKLMTKKIDEIKFTVNNINLKKEREQLYEGFDKIFLKLFPDFVSEFNSYFSDENKIVLKEGQLLNTELRIFALIRMGIHDAEKISKILDYSINTIYNYKARIKGKSLLSSEEFDKRIMEIHA